MTRGNVRRIAGFLLVATTLGGYALYRRVPLGGEVKQNGATLLSTEDRSTLEEGEQFSVYALQEGPPLTDEQERRWDEGAPPSAKKTLFFRHRIARWKPAIIAEKSRRKRILDSIYACIRDGDVRDSASCFNPRHAIRSQKGAKVVDMLLCFECHNAEIYVDGVKRACAIADAPRALLDQVIADSTGGFKPKP